MRLHKQQRIDLLQDVALFSGCSKTELSKIASLTTEHSVEPGSILTKQGDIGKEFFVVVEGTATATRKGKKLAQLGPGSFFGELALLDGGERTATVVADTPMQLLVLSQREFANLCFAAPSVARKIISELGSRLRHTYEVLDPGSKSGRSVGVWSL
jgi:CRP/FNR family transcriptional regulator, cyclic AMP receptor protein